MLRARACRRRPSHTPSVRALPRLAATKATCSSSTPPGWCRPVSAAARRAAAPPRRCCSAPDADGRFRAPGEALVRTHFVKQRSGVSISSFEDRARRARGRGRREAARRRRGAHCALPARRRSLRAGRGSAAALHPTQRRREDRGCRALPDRRTPARPGVGGGPDRGAAPERAPCSPSSSCPRGSSARRSSSTWGAGTFRPVGAKRAALGGTPARGSATSFRTRRSRPLRGLARAQAVASWPSAPPPPGCWKPAPATPVAVEAGRGDDASSSSVPGSKLPGRRRPAHELPSARARRC